MLLGLEYTFNSWTGYGFNEYAILETTADHMFINCYIDGKIKRKDITNKTDSFCDMLRNVLHWNMQHYYEPMEWFPSFYWTLKINTDDFNIYCDGKDNYPPELEYFDKILRYIGIT